MLQRTLWLLPPEVLQEIGEQLTVQDLWRFSITSKRMRELLRPIVFRHVRIKGISTSNIDRCLRDLSDVLPAVQDLTVRSYSAGPTVTKGEFGDGLLSTFTTFIHKLSSVKTIHFAVWVDASGANTETPINDWDFWPQLAALLALFDIQLDGRVKRSLAIEHPYTDFHLGRDALRRLATHFQHVGPLAFKMSVPYIDWEGEDHAVNDTPGSPEDLQWPGNLHPFTLQSRHEWDILSTALPYPVTHLEIDWLNAIRGSPRIVLPHLVSLSINESAELGELFRRLDAENLADLRIMLESPMMTDVVSGFGDLTERCKALKTFGFSVECLCEDEVELQAFVQQMDALSALTLQKKINLQVTLRFPPHELNDPIHPFQVLDRLNSVKHCIEIISMDVHPDRSSVAALPTPILEHVQRANISFLDKVDAVEDSTLKFYLDALLKSRLHTLDLGTPPLSLSALKLLSRYLPYLRTLRRLEIEVRDPRCARVWEDLESIVAHQQEANAWLQIAEECMRSDISYHIRWTRE